MEGVFPAAGVNVGGGVWRVVRAGFSNQNLDGQNAPVQVFQRTDYFIFQDIQPVFQNQGFRAR